MTSLWWLYRLFVLLVEANLITVSLIAFPIIRLVIRLAEFSLQVHVLDQQFIEFFNPMPRHVELAQRTADER